MRFLVKKKAKRLIDKFLTALLGDLCLPKTLLDESQILFINNFYKDNYNKLSYDDFIVCINKHLGFSINKYKNIEAEIKKQYLIKKVYNQELLQNVRWLKPWPIFLIYIIL